MVGDNLTSYPNLEHFSADDPKGLKDQLDQIRLPYKIISIYASGVRHVAWVSLTNPIVKKTLKKETPDVTIVKNATVRKTTKKKTRRK